VRIHREVLTGVHGVVTSVDVNTASAANVGASGGRSTATAVRSSVITERRGTKTFRAVDKRAKERQ